MLTYYCAQQVDLSRSQDEETSQQARTMLDLLVPITKAFISEVSQEATGYGIQILGGHGFIKESGLEQEFRDTRITSIYEGTTGLQGLDLLGRKVLASNGKILQPFVNQVRDFCELNSEHDLVKQVGDALDKLLEITDFIGAKASNPDEVNGAGVDYIMFAGYTVFAYFWARAAVIAQARINAGTDETAFYQAKLATAEFYFSKLLPRTESLALTIKAGSDCLMNIDDDAFYL